MRLMLRKAAYILSQYMSKKPRHQRRITGKPGRLSAWPDDVPLPGELAEHVSYAGNGKHKDYSSPNGEWIPNPYPGASKCARFDPTHWHELESVLKAAVQARCVQFRTGESFPSRVWAFVNGVLHEARCTNPALGEYHAFPLYNRSQWPIDHLDLLKGAPRVAIPVL